MIFVVNEVTQIDSDAAIELEAGKISLPAVGIGEPRATAGQGFRSVRPAASQAPSNASCQQGQPTGANQT